MRVRERRPAITAAVRRTGRGAGQRDRRGERLRERRAHSLGSHLILRRRWVRVARVRLVLWRRRHRLRRHHLRLHRRLPSRRFRCTLRPAAVRRRVRVSAWRVRRAEMRRRRRCLVILRLRLVLLVLLVRRRIVRRTRVLRVVRLVSLVLVAPWLVFRPRPLRPGCPPPVLLPGETARRFERQARAARAVHLEPGVEVARGHRGGLVRELQVPDRAPVAVARQPRRDAPALREEQGEIIRGRSRREVGHRQPGRRRAGHRDTADAPNLARSRARPESAPPSPLESCARSRCLGV